jgi:hypothetical protein
MARRGLKIIVDRDDPPDVPEGSARNHVAMAEQMVFGPADVREFVMNGIDGAWLDDPTMRRRRREWSQRLSPSAGARPAWQPEGCAWAPGALENGTGPRTGPALQW